MGHTDHSNAATRSALAVRFLSAAILLSLFGACVLQTETVAGPKGDRGPAGESGAPDASAFLALQMQLAAVTAQVADLQAQLAALQDQNTDPDCPVGYHRDPGEMPRSPPPVHCQKDSAVVDEIVKVGSGAGAFWIDRYEATLWEHLDGTGMLFGSTGDDYPSSFPSNGQWAGTTPPVFAVSRTTGSQAPSRYVSWFRALAACEASSKRLPTGSEWLLAARNTTDPGVSTGAGGQCNTKSSSPRRPGVGTSCKSEWGAEDMIGNLSEWTSDWGTSPGDLSVPIAVTPWPNSGGDVGLYGADATFNIQSTVYGAFGDTGTMGLPAALNRGGHWDMGTQAGLFMIGADTAPSNGNAYIGLRCVIFR